MTYAIEDLFTGKIARMQRIFTDEEVKICEKLTRDNSPVYNLNEDIWKNYYDQPIVPGLLAEGLINQVISEKLPGVACLLLQKELIFYLPVYVGDIITAELEIIDINVERNWVTQKVTCMNQSGSEVIKGQVVIVIVTNQN
jgi:3-hydroxybutyryl-CoA dehydratase